MYIERNLDSDLIPYQETINEASCFGINNSLMEYREYRVIGIETSTAAKQAHLKDLLILGVRTNNAFSLRIQAAPKQQNCHYIQLNTNLYVSFM